MVALTEVNSRHLSGVMRVAAAEIELERVLEDERHGLGSPALSVRRKDIEQQLDGVRQALLAIESERDWLEQEIENLDAGTSRASPGEWQ